MPSPSPHSAQERDRFVDDLLGYMTTEEKIGQLVLLPEAPGSTDRSKAYDNPGAMDQLRRGLVSGFMNVDSPSHAERLQRIAMEETRLGIPLLFAAEPGRGQATIFPAPLTAAASWDAETIELAESIVGEEASLAGANWALSPTIALSAYPGGDDFAECTGQSPWLAARIAAARIRGLQSPSDGMLACLQVDEVVLKDGNPKRVPDELVLILSAIEQGRPASLAIDAWQPHEIDSSTGMGARFALSARRSGYRGIMLSEWGRFAALAGQQTEQPPFTSLSIEHVRAAIDDGRIELDSLNDAAGRVLAAKFDLGLFSSVLAPENAGPPAPSASPDLGRKTALELARKSILLLRNEPALLPLTVDSGDLLVVGSAAGNRVLPTGGVRSKTSSIIDGLDASGVAFRFVPGLALREGESTSGRMIDADRMAIGMAGEAAKRARTVIVVLGDEAAVQHPTQLSEAHRTLIETLRNSNERIVLVTLGERPLDPDILGAPLPCVLHAGQLGSMSGHAIAEVLTGQFSPTAKLPYAICSQSGEPRLPFGHGLSYTEFSISNVGFELAMDRVLAGCTLRNNGDRRGSETVQLYVRRPEGADLPGPATLRGFRQMTLDADQREQITFELGAREFGRYAEDGNFVVEPGRYEISLGRSAGRVHAGEVVIPSSVAEAIAASPEWPLHLPVYPGGRRRA